MVIGFTDSFPQNVPSRSNRPRKDLKMGLGLIPPCLSKTMAIALTFQQGLVDIRAIPNIRV